ncbi:MAG: hypothetical protein JWM74_3809 [Myxococcaceae bacterium]|nr:hypothetical protein [Myxococcaceae bacterium]
MLQRGMSVAFLLFASSAIGGCAHGGYKVIKESANGGEVALDGKEDEARAQAEGYMRGRCGSPGFVVEQEGQVKGAGAFRGGDSAWRIAYRCKEKEKSYEEDAPSAAASDGGAARSDAGGAAKKGGG